MKIGILFPAIDHSQAVYEATMSAHTLLDKKKCDIVFFYEQLTNPFVVQRFGTAHVSHMMSFDGVLMATEAHSARRISEVITSPHKVYYPYNLEWRSLQPIPYEQLLYLYRNMFVIARSDTHKWAINNAFNINVPVVPRFNLELICTSLQKNS